MTPALLAQLAHQFGTPLWIYDAKTIAARIEQLKAFDTLRYAQKAASNIYLLRLMRQLGVKVDAVSLGEVERALLAGYLPADDELVLTCDLFDHATLARVVELDITVNVGSIDMLSQLGVAHPRHRVWLRINPGFGHGHSQKTNTGGPSSKHGIWHTQLAQALEVIDEYQLHLVGLHMHIGSGVDYAHLGWVADAMVQLCAQLDSPIEAISAGGGLSIPYQPGQSRVDCEHYFFLWDAARQKIAQHQGAPLKLEIEPGRFLVAEAGCLIAEVRAVKVQDEQNFILVDAGFNDLMRPVLYGSFHRISLLRADGSVVQGPTQPTVVGGPLCESGDVFTQDAQGNILPRDLSQAQVGDLLVFHDTGAYGASMSSNYNSRGLAPEVLLEAGHARLIRRRQTLGELLSLETVLG